MIFFGNFLGSRFVVIERFLIYFVFNRPEWKDIWSMVKRKNRDKLSQMIEVKDNNEFLRKKSR